MTQTSQSFIRSTALLLAVCSALGVLALLLMPTPGSAASVISPVPPAPPATVIQRIAAIPAVQGYQLPEADELVMVVLGNEESGQDVAPYTTTQVIQIHAAADQLCAGMAAGVPLVTLEPELAQQYGLDGQAAHDFVFNAHAVQCPQA